MITKLFADRLASEGITVNEICPGIIATGMTEKVKEKYKGDMQGLFASLVRASEEALAKTPDQLPVLKEVNLVDAGGYGFVIILSGMLAALQNNPVPALAPTAPQSAKQESVFSEFNTEDITFSYCTECIVRKSEEYLGEDTAGELHDFLRSAGDSVVFIDDEEVIKLHVHTDHPGEVMEHALKFGSLLTVKIENMREQHSALVLESEKPAIKKPSKKYGFVSVCLGDGIADAFRDIGVDTVVYGGQTMNPSTQDIIDAVNSTPAENVYVLPNNKNIYMVAEQAAKLIKDKKVRIIPTKSVPQGISAMIAYTPDETPEQIFESMKEASEAVTSMSVTSAVRNATVEGATITDGQVLGLVNGNIECVADSDTECLERLSEKMADASFIMVFCGEGVGDGEMSAAEEMIRKAAPMAEVSVMYGGQPLYPYIVSVE